MTNNHNPHSRFLLSFFLTVCAILVTIGSFNLLIDPYNIFETPTWHGINQKKKDTSGHFARLFQAAEIIKLKPQAILFGSSRVIRGFDPHDLEQLIQIPSHNGGMSGTNFEEIYGYFEHALYNQPKLKTVIIGLDFFAFDKRRKNSPDFSWNRLSISHTSHEEYFDALFGKLALKESLKVVYFNLTEKNNKWTIGFIPGDLPEFDEKYIANVKKEYGKWQVSLYRVELFRKLVEKCRECQIDLKVFISPAQTVYWDTIREIGMWPAFEQLKRDLSAIHPIWDFSGSNCITTKEAEKDGEPLYYECSHFRPYVGKLILNKMYGASDPYPTFGVLLE